MKTKRNLNFYMKHFLKEIKQRIGIKRAYIYQKPVKLLISHTYSPYAKNISEAKKLDIIGQCFLENKMVLQKN